MPLDQQIADEVVFTCESCGREQGVRALRRLGGNCQSCRAASWRLTTKYHEGPSGHSLLTLFLGLAFDIHIPRRLDQTIELVTSNVSGADAADIAKLGWNYKRGAFRYTEMRQEMDAQTERENQKAQGARNCERCGYFFVPAAGKPWTQVGYCSQACFGSANIAGEISPSIESLPQPPKVTASKTIAVVCKKGHGFEVAAMYAGTFRPCPVCKERTAVS